MKKKSLFISPKQKYITREVHFWDGVDQTNCTRESKGAVPGLPRGNHDLNLRVYRNFGLFY